MAAEDVSNIRVLIPDNDAIYGDSGDEYLWTDEELERFFTISGNSVLRAAGLAMIAVGNSEAMIGKVIITQDLETDSSKLQKEWRDSGRALLKAAADADFSAADGIFEIIDFREGWYPEKPELTEGYWPYGY